MKNKHGLDNTHTTKDEDTPKAEAVGQYSIEPTSHCESTSAEIYRPNTVTMEEHNNVVEIANGWKTACKNLQHSWNNIAPTIAHTPESAPTFAPTPTLAPALAPAPPTVFVKNMQLEEFV